jgi:predicted dehydrogenase
VKVAVIGLGSAGSRHARNLLELGHDVVGFDPAASPPEGVEPAGSLDAAIAAAEAVIVASPTSLHGEQTVAALEQSRHVLVEKPLAVTVAEAERVVDAAERMEVVCGVAMNLRFHPGIVELKRLLDQHVLGIVGFVQASFGYDLRLWHPNNDYRRGYSARADLGGGVILDAIHELDYLLWLLGPVETASAEAAHVSDLEIDVEDVVVVALRFESGALGAVDLNFFEPAYRRTCLLVGFQASACWDWRLETITVRRKGEDDQVLDVHGDLADTYRSEIVDFLRAAEHSSDPRTPARDGLEAVRLAEVVKGSAASGRRVLLREDRLG